MGIALISGGVSFVAGGPALTAHPHQRKKWKSERRSHRPPAPGQSDETVLYLSRDSSRRRIFLRRGDVVLALAMKQVGDVHEMWDRLGYWGVAGRVLSNSNFFFGVAAMAAAFFSLLFSLSWGDGRLVAPAAASLTFIGNACAAKIFLQ